METFHLRAATTEDAMSIASVQVKSWDETYRGLIPDAFIDSRTLQGRFEMWSKVIGQPGQYIWVARSDDEVVGFVSLGPSRRAPNTSEGELYALYLLRSHQGRGIGRALFEQGRSILKTAGYTDFVLTVLAVNPAVAFYRRMGGIQRQEITMEAAGETLSELVVGYTLD